MWNRDWRRIAFIISGGMLTAAGLCQDSAPNLAGRVVFSDPGHPPPWIEIPAATRREFDLGHQIFNAQWQPAGTRDTTRPGLGPLFVESSCDACHDDGARGRPPAVQGALSNSFVMQLGGPLTDYGHVLNTRAIDGHIPEGRVTVTWQERTGRYADGERWTLRAPQYSVDSLSAGQLGKDTVLKPRIGPALFGVGLLDAVPTADVDSIRKSQPRSLRGTVGGRFGWQGSARSLVDQTAIAFAREMGLTSEIEMQDDCTQAQSACRAAPAAGTPELSERFFHALTTFQFLIAAQARASIDPARDAAGSRLFEKTGCAACHVPQLPVPRDEGLAIRIDPYTDLLLHDMGEGLADRTVTGRPATSHWRTAPLWGLAKALETGGAALLHDGRAASIEEAILWHEGQADAARRRFMALDANSRRQLLEWIATL